VIAERPAANKALSNPLLHAKRTIGRARAASFPKTRRVFSVGLLQIIFI
jgi:hypothetical protein